MCARVQALCDRGCRERLSDVQRYSLWREAAPKGASSLPKAASLIAESQQVQQSGNSALRSTAQASLRAAPFHDEWEAALGRSGWPQHETRHWVYVLHVNDFCGPSGRGAKFYMASAIVG
jgi:hypothetical protein